MAVIVFDLDMTVVDSSHRHVSNSDGSIDLAHWFENVNKAEGDTLMPLAKAVKRLYNAGHNIVLCTARCMQQVDYNWLAKHNEELPHHMLFSRRGRFVSKNSPEFINSYHGFIGDTRRDELIKLEQIQNYIESLGYETFEEANVIIFEDNLKTIEAFNNAGAIGINATIANEFERKRAA